MSDRSDRPSTFDLEFLKKDAKRLLRACRAGDPAAIGSLQAALPRLRALDATAVGASITLADVQHAVAIREGFASWADLGRHGDPFARLVAAVRGSHVNAFRRQLVEFAPLADVSVHAAAALGNDSALARHLEGDPSLATAADKDWAPLMYVCSSPLHRLGARHAAALVACATRLIDAGADVVSSVAEDADFDDAPPPIMRALMGANMTLVMLLKRRGAAEPYAAFHRWLTRRLDPESARLHPLFGEYFQRPDVKARFKQVQEEFMERMRVDPELSVAGDPREIFRLRMPNLIGARQHLWDAMLDRGFDPAVITSEGTTPLHALVSYAPPTFVDAYLSRGGNPNVRDAAGRSVVATAVRAGNHEVADLLRERGAVDDSGPMDELLGACLESDRERAQRVLSVHPGLSRALSREDIGVLTRAAGRGDVGQVRTMLEMDIAPDGLDESGATALHQAAWSGHVDVIRVLLSHEAVASVQDELYGQTPREWAAQGPAARTNPARWEEAGRLLERAERGHVN